MHVLLGLGQPLSHVLPVGHLVDGLDVIGPDVLVLQVVSVLPDVDAKEWNQTGGGLQRILVGAGGNAETTSGLVVAQPAPAGALDGHGGRRELLLHGLEGAKVTVNQLSVGWQRIVNHTLNQRVNGFLTSIRPQVHPSPRDRDSAKRLSGSSDRRR